MDPLLILQFRNEYCFTHSSTLNTHTHKKIKKKREDEAPEVISNITLLQQVIHNLPITLTHVTAFYDRDTKYLFSRDYHKLISPPITAIQTKKATSFLGPLHTMYISKGMLDY